MAHDITHVHLQIGDLSDDMRCQMVLQRREVSVFTDKGSIAEWARQNLRNLYQIGYRKIGQTATTAKRSH